VERERGRGRRRRRRQLPRARGRGGGNGNGVRAVIGGGDGKKEMVGPKFWRGIWRPSRNGGWEGGFGGAWKMQTHTEALLELDFYTKPLNFGVPHGGSC
jgi:hypothetical protein